MGVDLNASGGWERIFCSEGVGSDLSWNDMTKYTVPKDRHVPKGRLLLWT